MKNGGEAAIFHLPACFAPRILCSSLLRPVLHKSYQKVLSTCLWQSFYPKTKTLWHHCTDARGLGYKEIFAEGAKSLFLKHTHIINNHTLRKSSSTIWVAWQSATYSDIKNKEERLVKRISRIIIQ
jgi:hypothetical protein